MWWNERSHTDLLAFTLDKSAGSFSPTTRYRDYAINRELIHWESQSATALDSEVGRRYVSQRESGTNVRALRAAEHRRPAFWCLGPATYVSHQGERPIAITWKLAHPLPGDLFAESSEMIVFLVLGIGEHLEQLRVTAGSAAVLGRARVLPVETHGVVSNPAQA